MERTASFCTPAFLPQPGAGFHPLPWEQQPAAHSRLSTWGKAGHCQGTEHISPSLLVFPLSELTRRIAVLPTDTLLLPKPQGPCRTQRGSGTCPLAEGPCAHMGLTRGQAQPQSWPSFVGCSSLKWNTESFSSDSPTCCFHPATERRPGPAGLRFSSSPGKLPLLFVLLISLCGQRNVTFN